MSSSFLDGVTLPRDLVRDLLISVVNAGNYVMDINNTANALGLDILLINQGAAPITISVNGGAAITIAAGAAYVLSSTKWWILAIVAAVNYDLQMSGVKVSTLRKLELLP